MGKKLERPEVGEMLWTLNYLFNYLKEYGNDNDYDHDFALNHLDKVVNQINKDKELKGNDVL